METLATQVLKKCRARGWTLATAESCTGGMVITALTDIAGSSDVVDRGFVTYSNSAKIDTLGVKKESLAAFGAVSEQVAKEMAQGALEHAGVDITVSITGIAGPGSSEHKPEGRVCFALAQIGKTSSSQTIEFGSIGRANVRMKSTEVALNLLLNAAD